MPIIITAAPIYDPMAVLGSSSSLKISSGPTATAMPASATASLTFDPRLALDNAGSIATGKIPLVNSGAVAVPNIVGAAFTSKTTQKVGAIPMFYEDESDARENLVACEYINPVFGKVGETAPSYENDFSSFLIEYSVYMSMNTSKNKIKTPPNVVFSLQKMSGSVWATVATLSNDAYGRRYPLGSIAGHHSYVGYSLNWGVVLANHGAGCYRVRITETQKPANQVGFISESFALLAYSAERARSTVKFEYWLSGKIGDVRTDYGIHNLDGMWWYDSIRIKGKFGNESVAEYREVFMEWGSPYQGKMDRVKDEAVQQFELQTHPLPKYIHERLSIYAMMSNSLLVSDYNVFNSDYGIKRLAVIKDGAYEPEYYDDRRRRLSSASVKFKRAVQGVIKTNC